MLLADAWVLLCEQVFSVPSTSTLFNPYRDRHDALDLPDAPAIRQTNAHHYLACYDQRPPLFLLAEAPGPWGCRFSGVPLVSEAQLADASFPIQGQPTSLAEEPHREYSANIYWRILQPYFPHFFTWNSVPFHPHHPGEPLTIRTPKASEVKAWTAVLADLVAILRPERVLAVGRKAEYALKHAGVESTYVRHPSQGGARLFEEGVVAVLQELGLAG